MTTFKRLLLLLPLLLLLVPAASATAATPGPGFIIDSFPAPTNFSAAESAGECATEISSDSFGEAYCDSYQVTVVNAGSEPTDGQPVTVSDTLPAGERLQSCSAVVLELQGADEYTTNKEASGEVAHCTGAGSERVVKCTYVV